LSEDYFRHAGPERAMVIDLSEAEIFKRKVAQAIDGVVRGDFATPCLLE
jgi:hypothetical protein